MNSPVICLLDLLSSRLFCLFFHQRLHRQLGVTAVFVAPSKLCGYRRLSGGSCSIQCPFLGAQQRCVRQRNSCKRGLNGGFSTCHIQAQFKVEGELFSSTCHSASGSACVTCLLGSLLFLPISVLAGGLEGALQQLLGCCLPASQLPF